jgi:hypothetical protein
MGKIRFGKTVSWETLFWESSYGECSALGSDLRKGFNKSLCTDTSHILLSFDPKMGSEPKTGWRCITVF